MLNAEERLSNGPEQIAANWTIGGANPKVCPCISLFLRMVPLEMMMGVERK
ncbi:MAG: hypothetical protein PVI44_07680 [Balneolaceae bacterium]